MHVGNLATSLSNNDRISSFYWIRGSKHCFLTSFSKLNRYFLFLVFSCNCYLLVYSRLSRLRGNPISHPIFLYLWFSEYHLVHAPPYFWHTWHVFLKQDARGNLVLETVPVFFPVPPSPKVTHVNVCWAIANHTFSSHIISLNWHSLAWHKIPLSQCSTAQARNPQGIEEIRL